jgi:hypothetical protein
MLAKVAGKDTQTVVSTLIKQAKKLPKELYKSLIWERGKELTDHRRFTLATKIGVYFCDPQSPWQRGPPRLAAQKHDAALWLYVNALIQSCVFLLPTSLIHEKPP